MNDTDAYREINNQLREIRKSSPEWFEDIVHASSLISVEAGRCNDAALEYTYNENANIGDFIKHVATTAAICVRILNNIPGPYLPSKFPKMVDSK